MITLIVPLMKKKNVLYESNKSMFKTNWCSETILLSLVTFTLQLYKIVLNFDIQLLTCAKFKNLKFLYKKDIFHRFAMAFLCKLYQVKLILIISSGIF